MALLAVSACSPTPEPEPAPSSSPEPSALFDFEDWDLQPDESLREGLSGQGAFEQVIETPGLGEVFSLYAQCHGEMTVDVIYQGEGVTAGPFSPECDGVLNRRQVYLDPATPVESLQVVVVGAGDWAVAVADRDAENEAGSG